MANETPAAGTGGSPSISTGAYQAFIDALTAATRQILSGVAVGSKTISSGSITPTETLTLKVDTEGAAASDDLDNIVVTNVAAGRFALLRAADSARTVIARHAQGGSGQLLLKDGANFTMDDTDKAILLVLEGTDWIELARFHGSDGAAFGAFIGLGSAAFLDSGTASAELPSNADLLGKVDLQLPIDSFVPDVSAGPSEPQLSQPGGTGTIGSWVRLFPDGSTTRALRDLQLPKGYDGGALEAAIEWSCASAAGLAAKYTVEWLKRSDGDSASAALSGGTSGSVTDTAVATANAFQISSWFSIGNGGSATAGEQIAALSLKREGADGADTLTESAAVRSVLIRFTRDALNDS